MVERFVKEKEAWINAHVLKAKNRTPNILESGTKADYLRLKDKALRLAQMHLDHFNAIYKLTYKKISIRNQKTRWGSCSSTGTLSFNYRIVHLSPEAQDYIIVHELCHVAQMNHSAKFWRLVEKTIPDYRKICTAIRQ